MFGIRAYEDAEISFASMAQKLTERFPQIKRVIATKRKTQSASHERIKGMLVGIGTRTGQVGDAVVIKEVFPNGPAEAAGLAPGDKILRIDGVSTLGAPSGTVSKLLRGDENTEVVLQIERMGADGIKQVFDAVLVRREVMIPNVHNDLLANGVLHVQIDHFSDQTVSLVRRGLQAVPKGKLNGVVLDLRGHGGRRMLQACRVAALFPKDRLVPSNPGRDPTPVDPPVRESHHPHHGREARVPDLLLLARMMPRLDGFGVLDTIRNNPLWANIPVVVLTAKDLSIDERMLLSQSSAAILEKGAVPPSEVLDHLRSQLSFITSKRTDI